MMTKIFWTGGLVFVVITLKGGFSKLLTTNSNMISSLTEMKYNLLARLVAQFFEGSSSINLLAINTVPLSIIVTLHKHPLPPIQIFDDSTQDYYFSSFITLDNISSLISAYKSIKTKPSEKYVFYISDYYIKVTVTEYNIFSVFEPVFIFFWYEKFVQDVVIVANGTFTQEMFYFAPYSISKVNRIFLGDSSNIITLFRKFSERVLNMKGQQLKVTIFPNTPLAIPSSLNMTSVPSYSHGLEGPYVGIDGYFIDELVRRFNFSLVTFEPPDQREYGIVMENGTASGALGDILNRRADIEGNARFLIDHIPDEVTFIHPALYDNRLCVLVPSSKDHSKSGLIIPINSSMCLVFLAVALACSLFISFLDGGTVTIVFATYFSDVLSAMLGIPLKKLILYSSIPRKLVLSSCLLFAVVITGIYQSFVVTSLSLHQIMEIATLRQLYDSNLPIITDYLSVQELFHEVSDDLGRALYHHVRLVDGIDEDTVKKVETERSIGVVLSETSARLAERASRDRLGSHSGVHMVEECSHVFHCHNLIPVGSPFRKIFDAFTARLRESGIADLWLKDGLTCLGVHDASLTNGPKVKPFNVEDLLPSFLLLAAGLLISLGTLALESLWYRWKNKTLHNC